MEPTPTPRTLTDSGKLLCTSCGADDEHDHRPQCPYRYTETAAAVGRAATADDAVAIVTRFTGDRHRLAGAIGSDLATFSVDDDHDDPRHDEHGTSMRLAALRHIRREANARPLPAMLTDGGTL